MWDKPIDIYCERVDATFFSEPINAITNLAFIIAAIVAFRMHLKESKSINPAFTLLSAVLFLIGVGSFLFHTFANRWSELADVIPIWSFVVLYVMFALRYIFDKSWAKTARTMIFVFIIAYIGLTLIQTDGSSDEVILNGSFQYAPALFFMIIFAFGLYLKHSELYHYGFYAVGLFMISLSFRTVDMSLCGEFALGTHFVWHILNAVMLYILLLIMHKAMLKAQGVNIDNT